MRFDLYLGIIVLFAATACSEKGIRSLNSVPEAAISSHEDGDTVWEGVVTTFRGSVSDANDPYDSLKTTWYSNNEVMCETSTPALDGTSVCEVVLTDGIINIVLEVKNAQNATGSVNLDVIVSSNSRPEAEILSPEAAVFYHSNQPILFRGTVFDTEDPLQSLVVTWRSDLDGALGLLSAPDVDGSIEVYGYLSEGSHNIELSVSDSLGQIGIDLVEIEVSSVNSPLQCTFLSPMDGSTGILGDTVTLAGTANDVDVASDLLSTAWFSDVDGDLGVSVVLPDGSTALSLSTLSVGIHLLQMTVSDDADGLCQDSVSYSIEEEESIIDPMISADHDAIFANIDISQDGSTVYVTRVFHSDVLALSTTDLSLISIISVSGDTSEIKLSVDGTRAWVPINSSPGKMDIIDTDPQSASYHSVIGTVQYSGNGGTGVGIHPDGTEVYGLTQRPAPGAIHIISASSSSYSQTLTPVSGVNALLYDGAFSSDGSKAYFSIWQSDHASNLVIVSTVTLSITGYLDLQIPHTVGGPGSMVSVEHSSGEQLWVGYNGNNYGVSVVDMDTDSVILQQDLGLGGGSIPGICKTPDQSQVMLAINDNPLAVFSTDTLTQTYELTNFDNFFDCVVSPDGEFFYLTTGSGLVYKVDIDALVPIP